MSVHAASCCGSVVTRCVSPDDITPTTLPVVPNRVGRNGNPRRHGRLFGVALSLSLVLLAATAGTLAGYVCPADVWSPQAAPTTRPAVTTRPPAASAEDGEALALAASVAPARPHRPAVPPAPAPAARPPAATSTSTTTTTRLLVDACVQVAGVQVLPCEDG